MWNTGNQTNNKEGAMEAWGIFFAAFTLVGMLGLWIAAVRIEESDTDTTARTGDEPVEFKKAA